MHAPRSRNVPQVIVATSDVELGSAMKWPVLGRSGYDVVKCVNERQLHRWLGVITVASKADVPDLLICDVDLLDGRATRMIQNHLKYERLPPLALLAEPGDARSAALQRLLQPNAVLKRDFDTRRHVAEVRQILPIQGTVERIDPS